MGLLRPELWGLWMGVALLAASNATARTPPYVIPNRLSLGGLIAGLVASVIVTLPLGVPTQQGGVLSSLLGMAAAFAMLVLPWLMGGMSSGPIKMQMAYGAWVGCALDPSHTLEVVVLSSVISFLAFLAYACVRRWLRPGDQSLLAAQPWITAGAVVAIGICWYTGVF